MKKPCIFVLKYIDMRLFLIISITLISLSLNAQLENYSLFNRNRIYTVSNKEFSMNLKISKKNKQLQLETDCCIDCYDVKQPFYIIKDLKKLKEDFYFFTIKDYYFVVDLSTKLPAVIILNAPANDLKDCQLNSDF